MNTTLFGRYDISYRRIGSDKNGTLNPLTNPNQESLEKKWISMSEAALLTPYSAEYLSLRARKGKLASKKINNNWFTTKEAIEAYLRKQQLRAQMENGTFPMNAVFSPGDELLPQEKIEASLQKLRSYHGDVRDVLEKDRLTTQVANLSHEEKIIPQIPQKILQPSQPHPSIEEMKAVIEEVFDKKLSTQPTIAESNIISPIKVSKLGGSNTSKNSRMFLGGVLAALLIFSTLDSPFVLGAYEKSLGYLQEKWDDAGSVLGLLPGVQKNQILLLDKNGNVAITGHVETSDVFKSTIKDGIAPIMVESRTEVKNLNAELVSGLTPTEFTLAFVTSNGNITTEDVHLEGEVEVGKTLMVKGATKLLSALEIDGDLKVFGNAEFNQALSVLGPAYFHALLTAEDILAKGNLEVNKNIEATGSITAGRSIVGKSGSFTSLSSRGDFSADGEINLGNDDDTIAITSENFTLDSTGNTHIFGTLALDGALTGTTATLTSATSTNLFSTLGTFTDLVVNNDATITGNFTVGGDTTTIGQLLSTRVPTLAHVFSPWPTGTSNASDATIYINPATAGADTNIFAAAVAGAVKFLVDAEGDVYANNMILAGSVSQGETTIAGNLTVQDNVTLGDASSDLVTINGNVGIGTSTPQGKLEILSAGNGTYPFRIKGATNSTMLSLYQGSTGYAELELGKIDGTSPVRISTDGVSYFTGGNVGIGTTSPQSKLHVQLATGRSLLTKLVNGDTVTLSSENDASNPETLAIQADRFIVKTGLTSGALAERFRIDTTGNVGIGVTPSAWPSNGDFRGLQVGSGITVFGRGTGDQDRGGVSANAYYDGTGWKYIATGNATRAEQSDGSHAWYTAPSGTAGNAIAFTQVMTLDDSGNVGIGTTNPNSLLDLTVPYAKTDTTNRYFIELGKSNDAANFATLQMYMKGGATQSDRVWAMQTVEAGVVNAGTISLQPSGGNVGIGTTTPGDALVVNTATDQKGLTIFNSTQSPFLRLNSNHANSGARNWGMGTNLNAFGDWNLKVGASQGSDSLSGTVVISALSSGNVGIGTTGPNSKLQVHGGNIAVSGGTSAGIYLSDTEALTGGTYGAMYWNDADDSLRLQTNTGGDSLILTEGGFVGIGGIVPASYKLQVRNNSDTDYSATTGIPNVVSYFSNSTSGALNNAFIGLGTEANGEVYLGAVTNAGNNGADFAIKIWDASVSDRREKLRILNSGKVGINTVAPTANLQIGVDDASATEHTFDLRITRYAAGAFTGTYRNEIRTSANPSQPHGLLVHSAENDSARRVLDITSIFGTVASFGSNGNVGIGTTGPGEALDVSRASGAVPVIQISQRSTTNYNTGYVYFNGMVQPGSNNNEQLKYAIGMRAVNTTDTSFVIRDLKNSADRLTINQAGTVEIGNLYAANFSSTVGTFGSYGSNSTFIASLYTATNAGAMYNADGRGYGANTRFFTFWHDNSTGAQAGSITQTNNTTIAFNTTSDARLKESLGIALDTSVLKNTIIRDFIWKGSGEQARGVFAQEAASVLPIAVYVGDNGEAVTNPWQVDYSKYVPDLIVGWQDHERRIEENASSTGSLLVSVTSAIGLDVTSATAGLSIEREVTIVGGLRVDQVGAIGDIIALQSDVEFFGRPYFNNDTGGLAVVQAGSRKVDVVFEDSYIDAPVVNASITLGNDQIAITNNQLDLILNSNIKYVITNRSANGFSIVLAEPATEEITFSWMALAIRNIRISNSADTEQPGTTTSNIQAPITNNQEESTNTQEPIINEEPEPAPVEEPTATTTEETIIEEAPAEEVVEEPTGTNTQEPITNVQTELEPEPELTPEPEPAPEPVVEEPTT